MAKRKSKNPFISSLSEKDVKDLENKYFTVQVGNDFLQDEDGIFAFTERTANSHRDLVFKKLKVILDKGTDKEKKEAEQMIRILIVAPLRIQ